MRYATIIAITSICFMAACGKGGDAGGGSGEGGGTGEGGGAAASSAAEMTPEKAKSISESLELGEGWTKGMKNASSDGFMVTFAGPENANKVKQNVMITAMRCFPATCKELKADVWKQNEANLKMKLSKELAESPGLTFDISETTVDGKPAIAVYTLGYMEKDTADGGKSRVSAHSYDLFWHNGKTMVTVSATPGYSGAQSLDEVKTKMTKEELEKNAKDAMGKVVKAVEG
ncbi:MAG: hypothetical protein KC635_07060 [Myxococcales bacterium]|nr:hypothetical protein [Myxococcales bacterium]MCB9737391.1 hypothetical protein [Deltaproteobacteria bacterium]